HCARKYKYPNQLKVHVRLKHEDTIKSEIESKCLDSLTRHSFYTHTFLTVPKWYKCHHCSHLVKCKANLKRHILFKHTSPDAINWFQCEQCDYKAKTA